MRLSVASLLILEITLTQPVLAVDCKPEQALHHRVTICRTDIRADHVRLFLADEDGRFFNSFTDLERWLATQNQKLLFAMNAGMYHHDFSPVGLFIAQGKQRAALNTASGNGNFFMKPNGVFAIAKFGAMVVESSQFETLRERISVATQSGPLLLTDGHIHPKFKVNWASRLIRNGVCAPARSEAVFVISDEPMNLYEFAVVFRDHLGCRDALYFDGVVSSLYSQQLKRNDRQAALGPIIAVIASEQ